MADCSGLITNEDLQNAKIDAASSSEFVSSGNPTLTTRLGSVKKTVQGMNDDADSQLSVNQSAFDNQTTTNQSTFDTQLSDNQATADNLIYVAGYQNIGVFGVGLTVQSAQDTLTYNGEEFNTTAGPFPYTTTGATPTLDSADWYNVTLEARKTVALYLNVLDSDVIYDTPGEIVSKYIYSPSQQKTYSVPADAIGKTISSVVGNVLNTVEAGGPYFMTTQQALYQITESPLSHGGVGDGVADDTESVKAAIQKLNPFPLTGATEAEASDVLNGVGGILDLGDDKVWRVTETINIPANVEVISGEMYFTSNPKSCIWYDGPALAAGVATLCYKKVGVDQYDVYDDVTYQPTGTQFDNGDYINASSKCQLAMSVITTLGTRCGVYIIGAAGSSSERLCVGENGGGNRIPDVGMIHTCSWGCYHEQPRILGRKQGLYAVNANGGTVFMSPYIDRDGASGTELEVPPYPVAGTTGSLGVTLKNTTITFYNPIVEHWFNPWVQDAANSIINSPHFETTGGNVMHSFFMANNSSSDITGSQYLNNITIPTASTFYMLNQEVGKCSVNMRGHSVELGYTLVRGLNSGAVLNISDVSVEQWQFGKLGDSSMISSINHGMHSNIIYVNATSGNNNNYGLHSAAPIETFEQAMNLAKLYGNSFDDEQTVILSLADAVPISVSDQDVPINVKNLVLTGAGSLATGNNQLRFSSGVYSLNSNIPVTSTNAQVMKLLGGASVTARFIEPVTGTYALALHEGVSKLTLLSEGNADFSSLSVYSHKSSSNVGGIIECAIDAPTAKCAGSVAVTGIAQGAVINGY